MTHMAIEQTGIIMDNATNREDFSNHAITTEDIIGDSTKGLIGDFVLATHAATAPVAIKKG